MRARRKAGRSRRYVRSRKAGERVMVGLRKCYARLRLRVNEAKSTVASAFGGKFLGYSLWLGPGGEVKRAVAFKAQETFKQRVRRITKRAGGRGHNDVPGAAGTGGTPAQAARIASNARRWWRNSRYELNRIMPIGYFDRLGVPRLS